LPSRTRQALDRRELPQERLVTVLYYGYTRLLQHDLGNQNAVGIAFATPGEAALLAIKPYQ
jgi:hypothetical protein